MERQIVKMIRKEPKVVDIHKKGEVQRKRTGPAITLRKAKRKKNIQNFRLLQKFTEGGRFLTLIRKDTEIANQVLPKPMAPTLYLIPLSLHTHFSAPSPVRSSSTLSTRVRTSHTPSTHPHREVLPCSTWQQTRRAPSCSDHRAMPTSITSLTDPIRHSPSSGATSLATCSLDLSCPHQGAHCRGPHLTR